MKEKLKDSRILWETIKVFFAVERSFYYFLTIITGVAIAKFARVLNFGNDIKIDGKNSVDGMKSAAGQIIFFDMIELIGYRITDYLTDVCFVKQQTRVGVLAFRTILRDSSLDLDLKSGKIQYFIRQGGLGMAKLLKNVVFFIFSEVIEMIFTLYFLGFTNKSSIIPLFTLTICSLLIILAHLKVTEYKIKCKRDTNISLVECDKVLYELLLNYDSIKSDSMEEKEIAKYYSKLKMYERSFIIYGRFEDVLDFFHTSSFIFTKGALMVYTFKHNNNPSELSSSLRTLMKSTKNIDSISSKTGSIYRKVKEGFLNARMAFDYIKEESHSDNNLEISSFNKSITFENVDIFAKKVKILVDLNFEIKQGQKVAFIGKNGRGKSTLFKTLLKLQNFTGKIEIDGISINKLNEQSYRNLFAYLPQNNFLFDDTIKNNMLYGVKHKVTDDLIYDLSEELNLHDSIMALKNEYNTISGERGENLSGGQRQKILIIRALLRNAQIYLFDEPFNNLDKESTHSFINMIKSERFKDKTVIMIIHSPEMLYLFDRVIDIDTNSVIKNIKTK